VPRDEKRSFVTRKQKDCRPGKDRQGDCWDRGALDAESRLVLKGVTTDFGEVLFEGIVRADSKVKYPLCPEGARACRTGGAGRGW
jgi:hypothetical protein